MKNIFLLLFVFNTFISFSQFQDKKVYHIEKVQNAPKIDGDLSDRVWTNLNIANNFSQISPNNGTPERQHQKTEVKICYDSKNIYFGVMMHDNAPDSILRELSKRDEENKNYDAFGIWLEPFNDSQVEYNFMVTAAGVQVDRKFSKTNIDKTWDAVWNSAVNINNDGWAVEFSIPFSQLRFPENNKPWAINSFLQEALNGQPIRIIGNGTSQRSYLYASDMAAWILVILSAGKRGDIYNLGSSEGVSLIDVANKINIEGDRSFREFPSEKKQISG